MSKLRKKKKKIFVFFMIIKNNNIISICITTNIIHNLERIKRANFNDNKGLSIDFLNKKSLSN